MSKLPTTYMFSHSGDRSVGIDGESVTVSYDGEFHDAEYQQEFVETIREALKNLWDVTRVTVDAEVERGCAYCNETFKTFGSDYYDRKYCSDPDCVRQDTAVEAALEAEQAAVQQAHWDNAVMDFGGNNIDYARDRNTRMVSQINGSGLRS